MKIRRILISQPAPTSDKSPFSDLVSKHDVEVDFRPFIQIEGVSLKEFRKQRVEILDHTAVIFTSRTAIDNFFRICEEGRIAVPDSMKYFCVTEAIALYLQKYIVYRKRKIFYGTGTFVALMEVVVKHKEEKFLVPLSEPHKAEIPITLTKVGVKYSKVILSRTVSTDLSDVDVTQYDIMALYSPADVKSFQANFPQTDLQCKVAVFGNNTAREALESGICVDIMSPTPSFPSLTMALDKFIKCYNAQESVESFAMKTLPEPPAQFRAVSVAKKKRTKPASDTEKTPLTK